MLVVFRFDINHRPFLSGAGHGGVCDSLFLWLSRCAFFCTERRSTSVQVSFVLLLCWVNWGGMVVAARLFRRRGSPFGIFCLTLGAVLFEMVLTCLDCFGGPSLCSLFLMRRGRQRCWTNQCGRLVDTGDSHLGGTIASEMLVCVFFAYLTAVPCRMCLASASWLSVLTSAFSLHVNPFCTFSGGRRYSWTHPCM